MKSGSLNFLEPSGPVQACNGTAFTYLLSFYFFILLTYVLTHPHTHSVEQIPSWEVNRFSPSNEIPRISCNLKAHYGIHKCPPASSIQSIPPTFYFLKIHKIRRHTSLKSDCSNRQPTRVCAFPGLDSNLSCGIRLCMLLIQLLRLIIFSSVKQEACAFYVMWLHVAAWPVTLWWRQQAGTLNDTV